MRGVGTEATKRTAALVLDGKTLESKTVDVPANGRATVEFLSLESPYGFHKAEIRIQPDDSLREDDRFPFAVERGLCADNPACPARRSSKSRSKKNGFMSNGLALSSV